MHIFATAEVSAALLQVVITVGLSALFLLLYRRHRKQHFLWWGVAWGLYSLRLLAIVTFLASNHWSWLYWHQVATGWTALAVLWAALVFSRQVPWHTWYWAVVAFPPAWSYVALFRLRGFLLAVVPTVAFLSLATLWTGGVLLQYRRRTGSTAAGFLAGTFFLWGLHHLDYPLLRARGAWNPWGYYLDIVFVLTAGFGILLLVMEELRQGLGALVALSGDISRRSREDFLQSLLQRPLTLRGVRGAALVQATADGTVVVGGAGDCAEWRNRPPSPAIARQIDLTLRTGDPAFLTRGGGGPFPFTAILPVRGAAGVAGALVIVSEVAAPFTALDERFLVALGAQIGAALENAELFRSLERRSADLERLSSRMIRQHEDVRRRLSRELHDETAQVFTALNLQLGALREEAPPELGPRLDRLVDLVSEGTQSIRRVTEDLRPSILDDLGLVPALRALSHDFAQWSRVSVDFEAPDGLSRLTPEADLALFRALQEGFSNIARHASARRVAVRLEQADGAVHLRIQDDGVGLAAEASPAGNGGGGSDHMGLVGMRERMAAVGGRVEVTSPPGGGVALDIRVSAEAQP